MVRTSSPPRTIPRKPPPLKPFPADSTQLVLQCPHIIDQIMASADRLTLVAALRVSMQFHESAGKALYHTVRIDGFNLAGFFLGALVGGNTNDGSGSMGDMCARVTDGVGASLTLETHSKTENAQPAEKKTPPNFKLALLANVRILSLGSHCGGACHLYGPQAPALLPHLDTLRIVPAPASPSRLQRLCDDRRGCKLFAAATARRVVLRNVIGENIAPSGWPRRLRSDTAPYDEVVWVLPTNGQRYTQNGLHPGFKARIHTALTTFIFHHNWELWRTPQSFAPFVGPSENSVTPLYPSRLVRFIRRAPLTSAEQLAVIGLETVQFYDHDIDNINHPTQARLRQAVREDVRAGVPQSDQPSSEFNDGRRAERITFRTLNEYAELDAMGRGVLDDGLPLAHYKAWYGMENQTKLSVATKGRFTIDRASHGY
ncbi:hypothetical protein Q8F55_004833 [Vanrija albida]|uniref:F-box domain-containing protein n=1 Tax=Vanrija albida TaxID=181172 RepID=A0ABR3Q012_9TREE